MMADNTIDIKVSATTDDIEAGMKRAGDSVNNFGGILTAQAKAASVAAESIDDRLKRLGLEKIDTSGLEKTSGAAVEASNSINLTAGSMRELVVVTREIATGNLTRLPGSLSILATRLGGIPPVAILATAGIAGLGYAFYEAIDSGEKFQKELSDIQIGLEATGRGDSFSASFATSLIDNLRQAADVSRDQAAEIVRSFESIRRLGQSDVGEIISVLRNYATATHETTEQASKDLEKLFGGDTYAGIKRLDEQFALLTPDQRAAADAAHVLGNEAELTRIAIDGLNELAKRVPQESLTGLTGWFNDLRLSMSGVNREAAATKQQLLDLAKAQDDSGSGGTDPGGLTRIFARIEALKSRNLAAPASPTSGVDQATVDRTKQQQEVNDNIKDGIELAERTNAPLIEQEHHVEQITRLQRDLNAAVSVGNGDAAQKIQAAIEQENKLYAQREKRQQPKPDRTDDQFASLINEESAKAEREQAQADQARIDSSAKVGQAQIKTAEETAKQQYALGQTTAEQELATLLGLAAQSHAIEQSRFDQLATLYQNDAAKYTQVIAEKAEADQKYQQQVQQLQAQAAQREAADQQREQQQFAQTAQRMIQPWEAALANMGSRTNVWQQATIQAQRSIETNLVSGVSRMVANWLLGENEKSAATAIGAKFRELTQSQGSSEAVEQNIANTEKNQSTDAVGVFSNVFNYLSPELGPFAAAPAAAASAAVLALSLPSAAGGMIVPNDTLAMVHQNEMVLPARYTGGLTKMIDQANGGAGGGATNHFHVNVAANGRLNAGDLDGLHDAVVGSLRKAARNGQFGGHARRMSDQVFPSLPGIAWNIVRTPTWKTRTQVTISGKETRQSDWSYARYSWEVNYDFLRSAPSFGELQTLIGFLNARQGSFDSFLYTDDDDNTVSNQQIGTGDGITVTFPLIRTLGRLHRAGEQGQCDLFCSPSRNVSDGIHGHRRCGQRERQLTHL